MKRECSECDCVINNYWRCKRRLCANYTPPDPPKGKTAKQADDTPKVACEHRMLYLGQHGDKYGWWCSDCGCYLADYEDYKTYSGLHTGLNLSAVPRTVTYRGPVLTSLPGYYGVATI